MKNDSKNGYMMPLSALILAEKNGYTHGSMSVESLVLDARFWQALGKALGWDKIDGIEHQPSYEYNWQFAAHEFYDLVLTGGDVKAFWNDLLKVAATEN